LDNNHSKYGKENKKEKILLSKKEKKRKKELPSMQYGLRQGKNTLDILTYLVPNLYWSFKSRQ
jgi:hypothetical protein